MIKPLEITFNANKQGCNYNWKMSCQCKTVEHLEAMKAAINAYIDMKIDEIYKENKNEHKT